MGKMTPEEREAIMQNNRILASQLREGKGNPTLYHKLHTTMQYWGRANKIRSHMGGDWQGLTLYRPRAIEWQGTTLRVWDKMSPQNSDDMAYLSRNMDEGVAEIWETYFQFFTDAMLNNAANMKVGMVNEITSGRYLTEDAKRLLHRRENHGTKTTAMKWRPHKVQRVEVGPKLLSWLPPAEREILMLSVGRIMNADDQYQWRTVPFISGRPGLGKTLWVNSLVEHLGLLGYTSNHVRTPINRFTIDYATASCDLLLTDDTATIDVQSLTRNSQFKSLVSGAPTRVETKFVPELTVYPTCVWFLLGNGIHSHHLIGADPGVLDRIAILQCDPAEERSTDEIEAQLMEERGESRRAIWEVFLAECNYLYQCHAPHMEATIHQLRNELVEKPANLPLAEMAAIGAIIYRNKGGQGDPFANWDFTVVMDAIASGEAVVPPELLSAIECILWCPTVRSIASYTAKGVIPQHSQLGTYILTADGYTLPTKMAPYRRVWEDNSPQIQRLADIVSRNLADAR